jgi:toxin ParE1/3/4
MTNPIEYSSQAIADIAQIWQHHADRVSIRLADELVQRLEATVLRVVGKHKLAGRLRPELGEGVRSFPIVPYVVYYRPRGSRVNVERVLHGHRDVRPPLTSLLAAV